MYKSGVLHSCIKTCKLMKYLKIKTSDEYVEENDSKYFCNCIAKKIAKKKQNLKSTEKKY